METLIRGEWQKGFQIHTAQKITVTSLYFILIINHKSPQTRLSSSILAQPWIRHNCLLDEASLISPPFCSSNSCCFSLLVQKTHFIHLVLDVGGQDICYHLHSAVLIQTSPSLGIRSFLGMEH